MIGATSAGQPSTGPRRLRAAMVGGGQGAFIGAVHRHAMALDGRFELVAGALSSQPDRALESGRALGLAAHRTHGSWQALLAHELCLPADERVELVVIVTPNHVHYEVAKAFAESGFHVVCDKPLVHTSAQAAELERIARERGIVFAVTYNYIGYPMVIQAREMVRAGQLGEIRRVVVEYHQGWLATRAESEGNKQADWRTDPARSGIAGAMGDIGSHAENLATTVTGLDIEAISADLHTFIPGRRLDDDASMLLRFSGGARGVLMCSQVATGCENDLRLRVYGSEGSISWRQESPNELEFLPREGPRQLLTRGSPWLAEASRRATRLPSGHPEAFIEAFANIYVAVADAIQADPAQRVAGAERGYADVSDGARGVRFIEAAVASSRSEQKWWPLRQ
ncbi:Gfo/Idh/MocA family oxidoreductase [Variovorax dokdonensis]|uniref:Gfo/Idh/MocA family oxidoreductase n=1 Tax=Variovorax dokdonensis TaxID=344883 RepID=A0ABT7N935_9BURK|nr:Gfo/Idh/MocA family oxidoreductase [Variovorax dokdonensis]MDM0044462.1 Gfo/Idh/MocA family oxidoreductase [Variovorax dokdonensis]